MSMAAVSPTSAFFPRPSHRREKQTGAMPAFGAHAAELSRPVVKDPPPVIEYKLGHLRPKPDLNVLFPADPSLSLPQKLCDKAINAYQVSRRLRTTPQTGVKRFFLPDCGFYEYHWSDYSCSEYTRAAIRKHGVVKGVFKGFLRIMACNPFTPFIKPLQKVCHVP